MRIRQLPFALKVSLLFALVGVMWILLSDKIAAFLFADPAGLTTAQTYKGWLFIALTSVFLYILIKSEAGARKKAQQDYRELFDTAVEGIFRSSPEGRFIDVNPAMARIFGYSSPEEMLEAVKDISSQIHINQASRDNFIDLLNINGVVEKFEAQNLKKDGSIIWTSTNARAVRDAGGKVIYFEGFITDITKWKFAEMAQREIEARYHALIEEMPAAVYTDAINKLSSNFFTSPQILTISGYPAEEWEKDPELWINLIHPEDRQRVLEENERTNQTREPFDIEYRISTRDGRIVWIHDVATLVFDEEGNPLSWQGVLVDVTRQKHAEEALQIAESRYRALVERLPAVVFMDDFDNPQTTQYMSPRLKDLIGYTPEEWVAGQNMWENALHPEDRERVLAEDVRTNETGDPFRIEYRLKARDGHYVWIKEEAYLIRGDDRTPQFWQGILLDISDQKKAEEALRRREAILEAVAFTAEQFLKSPGWEECILRVLEHLGQTTQTSRVYLFKKQLSPEGRVLISQIHEWCDKGIEPQIGNQNLQDMDFSAAGYERWIRLFNDGLPVYGIVKDLSPSEQAEFINEGILSIICFPIEIRNDWWGFIGFDDCREEREWSAVEVEALHAAVNMLGAAIERKTSAETIQKSEISYRGLFNSVRDAIYVQDTDGRFLDVNDGAASMYGYPREYFLGKTPDALSAPGKNDLRQVAGAFQRALQGESQQFEFWGRRNNGEIFPKDVRLFKGMYFGREAVIVIAQDITERKRSEEALQRQLKELAILHTTALAETSATSADELIERVTNIIGDTLYPDNCGILMLDPANGILTTHPSYRGVDARNLPNSQPLSKGIAGKVASTRKSMRVEDVSREKDYYAVTPGIQSELCVPISGAEGILGVLNVESRKADAFTEADERLLNTIAGGLATALEKLQLFESEKKRRREADALREATAALTNSIDLDKVYETILQSLGKLIPYTSASIELIDNDYVEIVAQKGLPGDREFVGKKYPFHRGKWGTDLWNPIIIPDVQQDDRFEKLAGAEYIRGWMGVPLITEGKLIGYLNLDKDLPDYYTDDAAALARTFANQAAIAIEKARLFQSEQKRRQEAENLRVAATVLTSTLEPQQVLETILVALQHVISFDSASIFQLEGDYVRLTAAKGLPKPELAINQLFPANNELLDIVRREGQPLILADAREDTRFEKWAAADNVRGWMGIPLIARGTVIGFITMDSLQPLAFDENDAILAQTFAHQAATAMENARLYNETRQRLEELEIVSRISFALRTAQDSVEMLPILLNEIKKSMETDTASIWIYHPETDELVQEVASGGLANLPKPNFKPGEGIVGHIFAARQPHVSADFSNDPRTTPENVGTFGMGWGGIAVPIQTTSETIGVLAAAIQLPRRVELHHIRQMTTIAEIAGNAIYRSDLYERSEEQVRRLTTLREMDTAISSSFDLHVTLDILMEHLLSKMEVSAAAVLTFNPDSHTFSYFSGIGFRNPEILRKAVRGGEGLAGHNLLNEEHVYIADLHQKTGLPDFRLLMREGFVSFYGVPLQSKGLIKGVLEMYFRHPFKPGTDWLDFIHMLAGQAVIAIDNSRLFEELQHSNQELSLAYDTTLEGWGKALELRDKETEGHTRRVTELTLKLARQIGIPEAELTHIRRGVLLHDIGKMGVPDSILRKEGPLTAEETIEMRKHPQYAYDMLQPIPYLRLALDIPYHHHEWWDGNGYPNGLKGEGIPLAARIFSIVDVWDALLSDRPYRKSWKRQDVIQYIVGLSGRQFDPNVVETFLKLIDKDGKKHTPPARQTPGVGEKDDDSRKRRPGADDRQKTKRAKTKKMR
jgi:PAS domain S-box-containing protein